MVRFTQTLCKYIPDWYHLQKSGGSYFKRQAMLQMTRYYPNLGWSQYKHAFNRYHYYLKGESYFAKDKSNLKRDYNRSRIAAACEEHGYPYSYFVSTLPKINIFLNLSSLARLSIYEPLTFKSLVDICKAMTAEEIQPANFSQKLIEKY